MAVHDPGKMGGELRPGMIFTIEPGVYDKETGIGVRIEDVVLVTEEGCEVLSADCPKSRAEIEALMAEKGILDLVDSK
jgi:Xaa-Pro aminopeptidase